MWDYRDIRTLLGSKSHLSLTASTCACCAVGGKVINHRFFGVFFFTPVTLCCVDDFWSAVVWCLRAGLTWVLVGSHKKRKKKTALPTSRLQAPVCPVMRMAAGWLSGSMCARWAGALRWRCERENVCFKLYEVQCSSQDVQHQTAAAEWQ